MCQAPNSFIWEEADFGQSRFGHPDLTNFGHRGLGPANFDKANFGQSFFFFWPTFLVSWWSPEGWGPEGWGPEGWGPEISLFFFPSPATVFILFSLSFGLFRGILVVFEAPGPSNVPLKIALSTWQSLRPQAHHFPDTFSSWIHCTPPWPATMLHQHETGTATWTSQLKNTTCCDHHPRWNDYTCESWGVGGKGKRAQPAPVIALSFHSKITHDMMFFFSRKLKKKTELYRHKALKSCHKSTITNVSTVFV